MSVKFKFAALPNGLIAELKKREKNVRNKALRQIGKEVAKILKPIMQAETPKKSGRLAKSYGTLVKLYRGGTVLAVIVGPRSKLVYAIKKGEKAKKLNAKEFHRDAKNRQWRWQRQEGVTYDRPSKRAHFAGEGRKSKVRTRSLARVRPAVLGVIRRAFNDLQNA